MLPVAAQYVAAIPRVTNKDISGVSTVQSVAAV